MPLEIAGRLCSYRPAMAETAPTAKVAYDQQLARVFVRPLAKTPVTPNMLTFLNLLVALGAGWLFAQGEPRPTHWAGALFMLAMWMDHWDGELARLTRRTSRFGHFFDHAVALATYVTAFVGIGVGLGPAALGGWAIWLGTAAGLAIAGIFGVRLWIELTRGGAAVKQKIRGGFEIEDTMYVLGPVAWLGLLEPFVLAAGIGAPVFLAYSVWRALR
jgi:phosphatidylglycerophosphate synthase